jgi:peroxiredoxin
MKARLLIIPLIMLLAAGLAYFALRAPLAPATDFRTLDGRPLSLDALRGKVVLVNFWATSCPGCVKEMPELIETWRAYRPRGFEVVAVAMQYDPPNYVAKFTRDRGLPFAVALDVDGSAARAFGDVQLTPTSVLIGRDGRIIEQKIGELDFARFRATLERALAS